MAIDYVEIINAAEVVAKEKNMRATATKSLMSGAVAGITTCMGGILAGPIGIAIGAIFGGVGMAFATKGTFKSVTSIIREDMSKEQKEQLACHLRNAMQDFGIEDVVALSLALMHNGPVSVLIFNQLKWFLENKMQLTIA